LKSFIGDINSELASSSALDVAGGRPINSPSANPSLDQQQLQKPAKTAVKPKQTGAEEFGSKLYNEYSKAKVQLPIGYPIDRSRMFSISLSYNFLTIYFNLFF
jgi:hypothetical protein